MVTITTPPAVLGAFSWPLGDEPDDQLLARMGAAVSGAYFDVGVIPYPVDSPAWLSSEPKTVVVSLTETYGGFWPVNAGGAFVSVDPVEFRGASDEFISLWTAPGAGFVLSEECDRILGNHSPTTVRLRPGCRNESGVVWIDESERLWIAQWRVGGRSAEMVDWINHWASIKF